METWLFAIFFAEALFCALVFALFCALLRTCVRALLQSFASRTTAFGNCSTLDGQNRQSPIAIVHPEDQLAIETIHSRETKIAARQFSWGGILGVFVKLSWGCCGAILGLVWGCYGVVARQFREGLKSNREAKIRGQV